MSDLMMALVDPLGVETSRLLESVRRSVVVVYSRHGHGSGVVWDAGGLIVTCDHVVSRAGEVVLEFFDGTRATATVAARDQENDLALVQVDREDGPPGGLSAVTVGDSTGLRVGEIVLAVGHPLGVRGTATFGIVSAAGAGTWTGWAQREVLQADIALAPGNSGGPLVNTAGESVGIASMVVSPGIAVAVPTRVVQAFVAACMRHAGRRAA